MEKDLVIQENKTAVEIKAQVNLIQEVMKSVMKDEIHFGTIPGCNKPSLYKPGSEIILSTFKLACEPVVEDLSTSDEARFRVTARLTHMGTGAFVGAGVGECSSNEVKYKWRKPVCSEEFEETPEDRKRVKWQAGYRGAANKKVKQIRTEIADVTNTILKMAKKRAQIDATLTATAASDIFAQDLEDIPAEILNNGNVQAGKSEVEMPEEVTPKVEETHTRKSILAVGQKVFKSEKEFNNWLKEKFDVENRKELSDTQALEANTALVKMFMDKPKEQKEN
jgi:hypothetical protein